MKTLEKLNSSFWRFFYEISDIPRQSGKEEKIAEYLINFAIERNLKYYHDEFNNVVIWKNASNGCEYKEILGLQCHTDMICEKKKNTEHDFLKDPIDLIIDGDFIKANNTTLGADNGIGVAYILAILDSKKIKTPKLECIFTAQEETTMNGAKYLDSNILQSRKIISFDNFNENEMWISSATAKEWVSTISDKQIEINADRFSTFVLELYHFKGGHSGLDIGDSSRGNPIKIIAELLLKCFSEIYIVNFEAGSKVNIIPRNGKICFSINKMESSKISSLEKQINKIKSQYPFSDISLKQINTIKKCYNKQFSKDILEFINNFQNGDILRDRDNNIILSGNFGAIRNEYENITLLYSIRYNSNALGLKLEKEINNLMKQYNIKVKEYTHILGYEQDENSKLIKFCENLYFKYFNKKIKKVKVQACLECGYFYDKIPNLQFIAIAPNIYDAHSPTERMSIKSANKMWSFIVELLEKIK
jgi:dipeptidase D